VLSRGWASDCFQRGAEHLLQLFTVEEKRVELIFGNVSAAVNYVKQIVAFEGFFVGYGILQSKLIPIVTLSGFFNK
jgi:hypothetical protein